MILRALRIELNCCISKPGYKATAVADYRLHASFILAVLTRNSNHGTKHTATRHEREHGALSSLPTSLFFRKARASMMLCQFYRKNLNSHVEAFSSTACRS